MDACRPVSFEQRAGCGPMEWRCNSVSRSASGSSAELVQEDAAAEDASDVCNTDVLAGLEQLAPYRCRTSRELLRGGHQNLLRDRIAVLSGSIHQAGVFGDSRAREFGRVEAMQKFVGIAST